MGSATGIDTDPFDLEREVSQLRQGLTGEVEAAAAAVDAAIEAGAGDPDGRLDARIVEQLARMQDPDPLLAWVDVRQIAVLVERMTARLVDDGDDADDAGRRSGWQLLDLLRRPTLLARLAADGTDAWADRMLALIEASRLTLGPLLRMRTETYGSKPLFVSGPPSRPRRHSWRQVLARVESLARGLIAVRDDDEGPVALLTENRIEAVWADLACLTAGIVNVPVPANATDEDVRFILDHCGAGTLIVSGRQLSKVVPQRDKLLALKRIIVLDPPPRPDPKLMTLDRLAASSSKVTPSELERRERAVGLDDLATVMYTSGTTGKPKAIQFSVRNLIFKRFARALALPEIGDRDVLLCYLPLYHTFGRFLEMMAAIFWGATYCFLESPSVDAMLQGMKQHRPTLFISVPKKWIQLHEAVIARADPEQVEDEEVHAAVEELTGGRLRYGLSAAGHLGSEIFRFFQRYGVELMSGFGMTEATGGITMTPPGAYRDETLGIPLPGIETRIAEDGELLVRGPYVMLGYDDADEPSFDDDGWFHTGDLMETDSAGYLRLVDRKKEIYKNVKGETIAPQRIENLFRDFESVGRVFLVGDHREYNTALIWPDPEYRAAKLEGLDDQEVKDHYRSVVVSVNKFIAPYERIVDFAIIDRDLSLEREELTEKGTPRRKTVEQNFGPEIDALYRRTNLKLDGVELMVPNWLFQRLGLTAHDIWVRNERIFVWSRDASLRVQATEDSTVRIGSCLYRFRESRIDLGEILTSPRLWLGNEELIDFIGLELRVRERTGRRRASLERLGRVAPPPEPEKLGERIAEARRQGLRSIDEVHLAAQAVDSPLESTALDGVRLLSAVLGKDAGALAEPVRTVLARTETAPLPVRRAAFLALVSGESAARFPTTLRRFLDTSPSFLDEETRGALVERNIPDSRLDCFVRRLEELAGIEEISEDEIEHATSLIRFLAEYGAAHPTRYRRMRAVLTRRTLFSAHEVLREEASRALWALQEGFRRWLGPTQQIAVDMENGEEYRWDDVVAFDEDVPDDHRGRLLEALRTTSLLREAVFLFSRGATVRLSDIPPGGVYLRLLGSRHGKSVYRLTVQTRFQGSYDIAVNLNHELTPQQVREEIQWLILCGEAGQRDPLVENFGGYWHEPDLWSEEFISGQTVDAMLKRLVRRGDDSDRLRNNWPFIAWSALKSYVDFWHRTGHRLEIADPSAGSVIVPAHDFLTGARLVSLSARSRFSGLLPMLSAFRGRFVEPVEAQYPELAGVVGWELIFSAVVEIVGEEAGLALFREALAAEVVDDAQPVAAPLTAYVADLEQRGFVPMRLMFAAQRYLRWVALGEQPTREARARTLQELYETYGLARLASRYPEARVRFFRESVFLDAPSGLIEGLDEIIDRQRKRELVGDEMIDAVAELRARLEDDEDLDYFLARLSFPYLRPEDAAGFVEVDQGGRHQSEMVVTREDKEGNAFRIRHALHPKEVGRLHRLFLDANLDVHFRPEHRYLVALNDRGRLIGGIYYEIAAEGDTSHLEKIVVAERYQRLGVAAGLMSELFNRLRAAGAKTVTTGFFRPEYFYAFGFKIERRYAGLVKNLEEEAS